MHFFPKLSLPVSVVTGNSVNSRKNGIVITETFSTEYAELLPNMVLLEMGTIYHNCNNKSETTITGTNKVINLLCKYMLQYRINSLGEMCSGDISMFIAFIKREKPESATSWKHLFSNLSSHKYNTSLANLIWPKCAIDKKSNITEGHSVFAYNQMGVALRTEIDRIRKKTGRLAEAMKTGRVITPAELDFVYKANVAKDTRNKHYEHTSDTLPEFSITKADFICTILHYLPGWPVLNRSNAVANKWGVYQGHRGIRLQCFDTKQEADALSADLGGSGYVASTSDKDTMNPAEIFLNSLTNFKGLHFIKRSITPVIGNILPVLDFYYPTGYDLSCVYLYWLWLTGWNNETIASVPASELNLGVQVGKKHAVVEVIAPEHAEIKGTAPTYKTSQRLRYKQSGVPATPPDIVTGFKTRSQPDDKPKPYTYICDKNNPYDLYKVLHDYYELTKPLRGFLSLQEKNCILVSVTSTGGNLALKNDPRNLAIYGAPLHCGTLDYGKNGLGRFFDRNPIYEDMDEFLDGVRSGTDSVPDDPASFPKRYTRLWKTDARKMRTTYHDWLQANGVPLFVRQAKMGHESDKTTTTSYGADLVSIGIRTRQLRAALIDIERLASQGQLQRYGKTNARPKKNENNVIQVFSHLQSDVFICQNPKQPSWTGHEEYVTGHCTEFDECLFCVQCLITPDSLPVLVRWQHNITDMPELVGPIGMSDKILRRQQAIEEVFDLCREGSQKWREELENAYEIEMDPEFTAPNFMYRYTREG